MEILADPREVDPGVLLIEEIERTAGVIEWLSRKIESLDEETEFLTYVETVTTEEGTNQQGTIDSTKTEKHREVTHWWRLLEAERKHLVTATTAAIRSGLEERRVRIAERSLNSIESALAMILLDFGLDPHSERVREVVGARLREALASGEDTSVKFFPPEDRKVLEGEVVRPLPTASPVDF